MVHAGGVHFSKDWLMTEQGDMVFGQVVEHQALRGSASERCTGYRWGQALEGVVVKGLSQEHGIIGVLAHEGQAGERAQRLALLDAFEIGDLLLVLPVHSCMTADAMGGYWAADDLHRIDHMRQRYSV